MEDPLSSTWCESANGFPLSDDAVSSIWCESANGSPLSDDAISSALLKRSSSEDGDLRSLTTSERDLLAGIGKSDGEDCADSGGEGDRA